MNRLRHHHANPLRVLAVALLLLAVFILWLLSVVLPITFIELRYQYKSSLRNIFHASDIRSVFFPQLRATGSTHVTNGITIPSVFIDEPIIYNVDPNNPTEYLTALKHGIAQAAGTALPGSDSTSPSGRLGYYFAHSSTPALVSRYNAVFYLLDKVTIGDAVYVSRDGIQYQYEVYAKQITAASDVSFLHHSYATDTIVLQTCWPPGTTAQRLLVFARAHTK